MNGPAAVFVRSKCSGTASTDVCRRGPAGEFWAQKGPSLDRYSGSPGGRSHCPV